MIKRILGCFIGLVMTFGLMGQTNKPFAYFVEDSLKIGEPVSYSLSYRDARNRSVIFPDSLYDFSPFELIDKFYFSTKSDTATSIDSAIYVLTTFEIDSVQKLSLPIFIANKKDSIPVFSNIDSIALKHVVLQMPDSLSMAETNAFEPVSLAFNYPYWIIGMVSFCVAMLVIFFVWGKSIRKKIQLYRLKKALEIFQKEFDARVHGLAQPDSINDIEQLLKMWKAYMEKLEGSPYTSLTTKEIRKIQQSNSLDETLKAIDRNIYSGQTSASLQNDFEFLRDYAIDKYSYKVNQIKNA